MIGPGTIKGKGMTKEKPVRIGSASLGGSNVRQRYRDGKFLQGGEDGGERWNILRDSKKKVISVSREKRGRNPSRPTKIVIGLGL